MKVKKFEKRRHWKLVKEFFFPNSYKMRLIVENLIEKNWVT